MAALVHVSDDMPGIRRLRRGKGFAYRAASGDLLDDPAELQRIRRLAIPPAYREVWICPLPNGHLQATGRDARGRKQYRYHPDWRQRREADKFGRLTAFGQALPRIRARVARDLRAPSGPTLGRTLLLATLVRLLDTTLIRIGNDEYARGNGSYGLTTLRNPHARVHGARLKLSFRGKSGVPHEVTVDDARLARVVRRCRELPGQELFQYEGEDGTLRRIGSADVNDYLHEAAGERFTAKDFRTWHASVLALSLTRAACQGGVAAGTARFDAAAVLQEVAARLRNTPAVCRKSYVHPALLALWDRLAADPGAARALLAGTEPPPPRRTPADEWRLLRFLRRAARTAGPRAPGLPAPPARRSP